MFWLKKLILSAVFPPHGGARQRLVAAHAANRNPSRRRGMIDARGHKLSPMAARLRELCGCNLEQAGLV